MINPFTVPRHHGNPSEPEIDTHEKLWEVVRRNSETLARLEERLRYNWLLGVVIVGLLAAVVVRVWS